MVNINQTMEITIKIEAETIGEFHQHLHVLQRQIRAKSRKLKLDPSRDEFKKIHAKDLCDSNCYGSHMVKIIPEMP